MLLLANIRLTAAQVVVSRGEANRPLPVLESFVMLVSRLLSVVLKDRFFCAISLALRWDSFSLRWWMRSVSDMSHSSLTLGTNLGAGVAGDYRRTSIRLEVGDDFRDYLWLASRRVLKRLSSASKLESREYLVSSSESLFTPSTSTSHGCGGFSASTCPILSAGLVISRASFSR